MFAGRRIIWIVTAGICLALLAGCSVTRGEGEAARMEESSRPEGTAGLCPSGSGELSGQEEGTTTVESRAWNPNGGTREADTAERDMPDELSGLTEGTPAPEQNGTGKSIPDQSGPGASTSGQPGPETSASDQSGSGESIPDQSWPEASTPRQSESGTPAPEQPAPGTSTPEQYAPGVSEPGMPGPDAFAPGQSIPGISAPEQPGQTPPGQSLSPVSGEPAPMPPQAVTPQTGGHIIAIDAGHQAKGNKEKEPLGPGSSESKAKVSSGTRGVSTGVYEYELNLTIAQALQAELEARGYTIVMIRDSHDVDISNKERAETANTSGAEIFLRIHANGSEKSSVHGTLTICNTASSPYNPEIHDESLRLSQEVLSHMVALMGSKDRGVWETDTMSGINWCTIPVTIVEMGYMSNKEEDERMQTSDYQSLIVQGIADGVDAYFAGAEISG